MAERLFKVKLLSGRILGPIDLERVRALIERKKIKGEEVARQYPSGDWAPITHVPELANLFIEVAMGSAPPPGMLPVQEQIYDQATVVLPPEGFTAALNKKNNPSEVLAGAGVAIKTIPIEPTQKTSASKVQLDNLPGASPMESTGIKDFADSDDEKTRVEGEEEKTIAISAHVVMPPPPPVMPEPPTEVRAEAETMMGTEAKIDNFIKAKDIDMEGRELTRPMNWDSFNFPSSIHSEPTIQISAAPKKKKGKTGISRFYLLLVFAVFLFDWLYPDDDSAKKAIRAVQTEVFRPRLPAVSQQKPDPERSQKTWASAMKYYILDTVEGYREASVLLKRSAEQDAANVKALAMLASSDLNLIDVSNKDETYFSVISKLIELSRTRAVDLPETVISDVEFFVVANKPEAAVSRIVEYTKDHPGYGEEMFHYLAYAFYHQGDYQNAARYSSQAQKAFSPKVHFLRGQIAVKLSDPDSAITHFKNALKMYKNHDRSRLALAEIYLAKGFKKEALTELGEAVSYTDRMTPKEYARAHFLASQILETQKHDDLALDHAVMATQLDRSNREYIFQVYNMKWKMGETNPAFRKEARMYYFLGEGEKFIKQGRYHDALTQFLEARNVSLGSPVPLVRIGDMFLQLNEIGNAKMNYKLASDRARENIAVWSKYINVLIQGFEWKEALEALERFRKLKVPPSAIDKLAGDFYAKQNRHEEAQVYYRKAMSHETIDPNVYISYAKSLMALKKYQEAPLFLALALRYDPLNLEAVTLNAKCVADSESIDRGIAMLENEIKRGSGRKSELFAAAAEMLIQKGDWTRAQQFVNQATESNPENAQPFRLQALIHLNNEATDKRAVDLALDAFKSYSDRNTSDPSGYLERYRIFMKRLDFEKASDELSKIYAVYPRYPNLHYFKGLLYSLMGNHQVAVEELKLELKNNEQNPAVLVALGKEYIELQNYKQAVQELNKAMQLQPKSPEAKHQAAYANYLMKNYGGAIALFRAALMYDKGNPILYKRLGMAYREVGDAVQASENFKKYLQMEPDAPDKAEFQRFL